MKHIVLILALFSLITACGKKEEDKKENSPPGSSTLKISAFNVQIFGTTFMSDQVKVNELIKIIKRYDILMIQEIRDASQTSIYDLQTQLNNSTTDDYDIIVSTRLGRTSSKEQYAFFYKRSSVSLMGCIQESDISDLFEREPYTCRFKNKTSNKSFSLISLHAKPDDVVNELNALRDVWDTVSAAYGDSNIIAMGDFNADCDYLSNNEFDNLDFNIGGAFTWHLSKSSDTTTSLTTTCAYDNFITTDDFAERIPYAGIFNFGQAYGLTQSLTQDISDHYPIELDLQF
jgi:endonuclease/exonuclease/phosphatase family metal-dependent hydrolase